MVPQPVAAVVLLFPLTDDFKKKRDARHAEKLKELGEGHLDPTIIWIKQTVRLCFILSLSLIVSVSIFAPRWSSERSSFFCLNRLGTRVELWRCYMLWLM